MLRRLRQLRLPLAVKCQLLFGSAAVIIIAAALIFPWRRMEQLTGQMDEVAARTLVDSAVRSHIADPRRGVWSVTEDPLPRLRWLVEGESAADAAGDPDGGREAGEYDPFERVATARLLSDPRQSVASRGRMFRYAEALSVGADCRACHAKDEPHASASAFAWVSVAIPSQVSGRQLLLNRVFLITAGLLAGTVAVGVLYLILTRLILGPVRVLQDAAERVAAGDLDVRADVPSGDEFQQFSETFNAMVAGLKTGNDQLRQANRMLDQKLDQLAETNVALFESNRLKSEFLASVSHELRTPLNSILGFAQLLRDTAGDHPRVGRYAENIARSGSNLLDLINDLLDLAKIEAGRMDVRSEPLSLPDLFEALAGVLKPLLTAKRLVLRAVVDTDVPILRTDPAKLQQVLYNLLSNAIKFSPKGGTIRLNAAVEPDDGRYVLLTVSDEGPGVPADQRETIFEKFRQADASVTREHGGTGLGLAISRDLAHLLGGAIGLDPSPAPGATFWVRLPAEIESSTKQVTAAGR